MTRFAVRRMKEDAAKNEGKLDVLLWWSFMTMDVAGRLMYGHDFDNSSRGTVSFVLEIVLLRC